MKAKVRKTTPEEEQKEKEDAFLKLTGEERIQMMRIVAERSRKQGVNYELRNKPVYIVRLT
jgi:hypothetical protein